MCEGISPVTRTYSQIEPVLFPNGKQPFPATTVQARPFESEQR
jgi:hypothetical protein